MDRRNRVRRKSSRSWDPVADWYTGWVGPNGSEHHRRLAIPALMDLLRPAVGERILDVGCGPGVLAPHVAGAGAAYTGVDASGKLIRYARRHHGEHGSFITVDATSPELMRRIEPGSFDAAVFLLSIQDIDPLDDVLANAAGALRPGGRIVLVMTHPCFRVPRQSGWGWDEQRRLRYRRIDRYLTPLAVPMKRYGGSARSATRSHHRPLEAYVEALSARGLWLDRLREIPTHRNPPAGRNARAEKLSDQEIPLLLGLRAMGREA